MKADNKVDLDENEKAKYTYFEELQKRVDVLQRVVDVHADILRQNNLVIKEETHAPFFDDDVVYEELEEEHDS